MGIFKFISDLTYVACKETNENYARRLGYGDGYHGRPPNTFPIFIDRLKDTYMENYKLGQQRAAIDKGSGTVLISP